MFDKASMMRRFRYQYDSTRLEKMLKATFGADTTFGDDGLRTLLMLVLRNATTDSPWPLSNNPGAIQPARRTSQTSAHPSLYSTTTNSPAPAAPVTKPLANRLVGILHGCRKTHTPYNEQTAWRHHLSNAA